MSELEKLFSSIDNAIKHERHHNYDETMYWCSQWRSLALALRAEIKHQWSQAKSETKRLTND